MCVDMSADMCIGMCVDMCRHVCRHVYGRAGPIILLMCSCVHMRVHACVSICVHTCLSYGLVEIREVLHRAACQAHEPIKLLAALRILPYAYRHGHKHLYRHVHGHVHRHMHGPVYEHVAGRACALESRHASAMRWPCTRHSRGQMLHRCQDS